jgi:hypothetical protein
MANNKHQQCLVVLGMHRSGTSALAGILHFLGVDLGKDLMPPVEGDNPKGFFENNKIVYFNETLLESLHSAWDDLFPLPEHWRQQEHLSTYRQEMLAVLASEFNDNSLFSIKDPRMCLLLPFWQQIFAERQIIPSYLIIVRNPLEVAASLAKRNGFSSEKSVILWMNAMLPAELYSRNHPRVFVSFDNLLKNPFETIIFISRVLSLDFPRNFPDVQQTVHEFLTPALKHHNIEATAVNKQVLSFMSHYYAILQNFVNTPDIPRNDLRKIDRLRKNYYTECAWFFNEEIRSLGEKACLLQRKEEEIQRLRPHYYAQLYIDTGAGFSETQKITREIFGLETQLEFDLSAYAHISQLRFDPLSDKVILKLHQIKILTATNTLRSHVSYHTNALYHKDHLLIFETYDPIIYLDLGGIFQPKTVIIELEYLVWGVEVYRYITQDQIALINTKTQELQAKEQALLTTQQELQKLEHAFQTTHQELHLIQQTLHTKKQELHEKEQLIQKLTPHYVAQLFVNSGAGFLEEQSIFQTISGTETQVEFDVSAYHDVQGFRFDPINNRVVLQIDNITIVTANNELHSHIPYQTNALYHKENLFIFETQDPIILFNPEEMFHPKTVLIQLTYLVWGNETYKYISEQKTSLIKAQEHTIQEQMQMLQVKDQELQQQAQAIQQQAQTIHQHEQTIQQHEQTIQQYAQTIQQHEQTIRQYGQTIQQQVQMIQQHQQMIQQHKQSTQQQMQTIQQQEQLLQQKVEQLQQHKQILQQQAQIIYQQAQMIQHHEHELRQKQQLLQKMEKTISWKITRPLRAIRKFCTVTDCLFNPTCDR